jgi:hypothetical protein
VPTVCCLCFRDPGDAEQSMAHWHARLPVYCSQLGLLVDDSGYTKSVKGSTAVENIHGLTYILSSLYPSLSISSYRPSAKPRLTF